MSKESEWKPIGTAPKDKIIRAGNYDATRQNYWDEYDCYYNENYKKWFSTFGIQKSPQFWIERHVYPNPPKKEVK